MEATSATTRLGYMGGHLRNFSEIVRNHYGEDVICIEVITEALDEMSLVILNKNMLELVSFEKAEPEAYRPQPINLQIKSFPLKNIKSIEEVYEKPPLQGTIKRSLGQLIIDFNGGIEKLHLNVSRENNYLNQFDMGTHTPILDSYQAFINELKSKL
ncbi:hypothetical protein QUF79_07520 [Fictibacillus enclensis]|uniref:hypothetical protein n=1 Tax=Fictibacillus enclensis TaxID=1017270 RepID=UPI0025A29067|nr:hypothetical protein [Fictibacillus enclensis]MDM5197862.1 hypothetical protein [Fictibacillus enclensis]